MQGNYRTEFRDYDGELPVIEGMKDNSWHNDAMPSMINESGTLTLWVNYVNPAWREVGNKLYCLCSNDPAGTSEKVIVETDDIELIRAYLVAFTFSKHVSDDLGDDLAAVQELNETEADKTICHSHDFIDSNQSMLDAMEELGMVYDCASQEQADLLNKAWSIAKQSGFDATAIK